MAHFSRHEHQHPRAAPRSGKVRRPGLDRPDLPQLVGLHRQQLRRTDRLWLVESVCGVVGQPPFRFFFSYVSLFSFLSLSLFLYTGMRRFYLRLHCISYYYYPLTNINLYGLEAPNYGAS